PPRPLVRRLPQPHPLAADGRIDAVADRVHHPGPVLVRDLETGRDRGVAPGLPVGRVHPGRGHPDPDLARPRLGHLPLGQLEDVRVTVARVDDCLHGLVPTLSYRPAQRPTRIVTWTRTPRRWPGSSGRWAGEPPGRVARPDEMATAVEFLLSAAASVLTGATLPMDGGRTILGREPQP